MASSRRAARANATPPAVFPAVEPVRRTRRTLHDFPGFRGIVWWEDGQPVKVYDPLFESALTGRKAVAFVVSLGWKP